MFFCSFGIYKVLMNLDMCAVQSKGDINRKYDRYKFVYASLEENQNPWENSNSREN